MRIYGGTVILVVSMFIQINMFVLNVETKILT